MCFRNGWIDEKQEFMTSEMWEKVLGSISQLKETETVMFAGMGEPLAHPKIFNMIKDVSDLGISTQLLTNGTMLDCSGADTLLESGLDMLWVSVDGFSRSSYEEIQIGSQYDLIYDNLRYFSKCKGKCKLGITFVIMRENKSELLKINKFADSVRADEINLSFAIPTISVKAENILYDCGISVGKTKRFENKQEKRKSNFCPFIEGGITFIKSNGDVCPCMQLLHSSYTYLFEEKRKVM